MSDLVQTDAQDNGSVIVNSSAVDLIEAAKSLHDEYLDYSLTNHLTGHNNHNVRWVRRALGMKEVLTEQEARAYLYAGGGAQVTAPKSQGGFEPKSIIDHPYYNPRTPDDER